MTFAAVGASTGIQVEPFSISILNPVSFVELSDQFRVMDELVIPEAVRFDGAAGGTCPPDPPPPVATHGSMKGFVQICAVMADEKSTCLPM